MYKIFIGGCDRSGTTFLASILGAAKGVVVTPESLFKNKTFDSSFVFVDLEKDWRFQSWGVEIPGGVQSAEDFIVKSVSSYSIKNKIDNPFCWIDHSPNNLENYNEIKGSYENVKFIHIIRNPYDVINSILPLEWGPNSAILGSLFWLKKVSAGLALSNREDVEQIKYESLISNPDEVLKLSEKLSLELDKKTKPVDYFLPEFTRKQHSFIGKVKEKSSERRNLKDEDYIIINKVCGNVIKNLGYELESRKVSHIRIFLRVVTSVFNEFFKRFIINPPKYRAKRVIFYENKNK